MATRIRIFDPSPATIALVLPDPEPVPLLYHFIEQETAAGVHTDIIRVFANEDGARCSICTPGTCAFVATEAGIGSCRVRRPGGLPGSLALRVL